MEKRTCPIEGCDRPIRYKDLCNAHYLRKMRFGDPLGSGRKTFRQRFDEKIVKAESGCWEWSGAHFQATGYAVFCIQYDDGKMRPTVAHRVSYELSVGPIPAGLSLDHLCRNRGCVNPAHLEPVTPQMNMLRGEAPAAIGVRTNRCSRGHEYTTENTRIRVYPDGKTVRRCMACARIHDRNRSPRRRPAA